MAVFLENISKKFNLSDIMKSVNDLTLGHRDIIRMYDEDGKPLYDNSKETLEFVKKVKDAGLKDPIWDNFTLYPNTHFSEDIVYFLDKLLGTVCTQCWINRVRPGITATRHRDFDNRESELLKFGNLERYSLHLGKPEIGHIFMVENVAMYMQEEGNLYKWDDHMAEHAGANAGFTYKALFIYRGLRLKEPLEYEYVWQTDNDSVLLKLKDGTII